MKQSGGIELLKHPELMKGLLCDAIDRLKHVKHYVESLPQAGVGKVPICRSKYMQMRLFSGVNHMLRDN